MKATVDFTAGRTTGQVLRFFFPLLMTNLLQQLYNFADSAIVGKGLGDDALAAVGNMSSLCFLIIGFSMGLSNGFSILIAHSFGEKDIKKLRRTLAGSISLAVIICSVLTLLSLTFLSTILRVMNTDESIIGDSLSYGYILFGGLCATILYNMSAGILRSLGDSKTPLKAIIISSVLNVGMNSLFIFVFGWGVIGAAVATVISQLISGAVCVNKLRKIEILALSREDFHEGRKLFGTLLRNGIPMACMNSITAAGCMAVQSFVNGLGVAFTSAYSACSKFLNMFMQPAATAGITMSAYTSQNYGAKRFDRIKSGLRVCLTIALVSYALFGSVMVIFPRQLALMLLNGEEQIGYAVQFLPMCGTMIFAVDMLFVIRSGVQGMGFPFVPMLSGIAEMLLRTLTIVFLIESVGFKATALAEIMAWVGALLINAGAFITVFIRERRKYEKPEDLSAGYGKAVKQCVHAGR
ncbi:MAG: MATE family efflux transporter [Ruminococcus sp.]|nr:MATE family efflux transporter [Ruminococcus sp.]